MPQLWLCTTGKPLGPAGSAGHQRARPPAALASAFPLQEQEAWRLNPQSLEDFVNLWSEYDDGSGSIEPKDLEALLLRWAGLASHGWKRQAQACQQSRFPSLNATTAAEARHAGCGRQLTDPGRPCRLQPPMGLGPTAEGKDVLRFVFDLDIPLVNARVPFHRYGGFVSFDHHVGGFGRCVSACHRSGWPSMPSSSLHRHACLPATPSATH